MTMEHYPNCENGITSEIRYVEGLPGRDGPMGPVGPIGPQGLKGETGDTWVPIVDNEWLYWIKDDNSHNPPKPVNIKGPQGEKGEQGPPGSGASDEDWRDFRTNGGALMDSISLYKSNYPTPDAKVFAPTWTDTYAILGTSEIPFKELYVDRVICNTIIDTGSPVHNSQGSNNITNGFVDKWGNITVPASTPTYVTFPVPYANDCYNVQLTPTGSVNITATPTISNLSKTGFNITHHHTTQLIIHWRAIGD